MVEVEVEVERGVERDASRFLPEVVEKPTGWGLVSEVQEEEMRV